MALIPCRECGNQVSTEAKACPSCGAKVVAEKKSSSRGAKIAVIIIGAGAVVAIVGQHQQTSTASAQSTPRTLTAAETAAKNRRDSQLQATGAAAMDLKRMAKDPESFKMKSVLLHPDGTACYEYRAKNSFGADLPGDAVLFKGKLLIHEKHGNAFVSAWNKGCTPADGEELAPLLHQLDII